ncbi:pyridoxal phosphate synthase yaaE subunit [Scopulibacillus darangshiensis]|uniref:Pyridoxal 5'-phosphate synthase subunit PdxT n=1 Tax=Scopulibacillus darangshiensis TaxID=442528 RepID=A0A4R2NKW8_9BACL|nr:pyridoxal 5'-phosphate synthase glutaminase subunit PdxT [Scopulibacillus darangshiensis]TCP22141.1 pyridoxal phosphate synthase yaaE subunit [Scopulibacillus darangshiensis]
MTFKIGVLGLQGAVREHVKALEASDTEVSVVKRVHELAGLDGLVIPGGESTTMRKLMDKYDLFDAIKEFAEDKPVFGTCAGLILMAKQIENQAGPHLALMDINVKRNAFGRQVASFEAELKVKHVADNFVGVFIRAPYISEVGPDVEVLSEYDGNIVACRQGNYLTAAFHPELTDDNRLHQYFVGMVKEKAEKVPV